MLPSPFSTFNAFAVFIAPSNEEAPKSDTKKLDPGWAAVYAAVLALVTGFGTTMISKTELFSKDSQVQQIIAVQNHKFNEVRSVLAEEVDDTNNAKKELDGIDLSVNEKKRVRGELESDTSTLSATLASVTLQYEEYKKRVEAGDHVGALETQNAINNELIKQRKKTRRPRPKLPTVNYGDPVMQLVPVPVAFLPGEGA